MCGFIEFLSVKGGSKTDGNAWAKEHVVGQCGNTPVVNFGLWFISNQPEAGSKLGRNYNTLANDVGSRRYLLATSSPTLLLLLESHVALAPASTSELTLW